MKLSVRFWSFWTPSCTIPVMNSSHASSSTRFRFLPALFLLVLLFPMLAVGNLVHAASESEMHLAGPVIGPETLDPAEVRDLSSIMMFRQIFRGLMLYDADLNPVPEVAESVDLSTDGLTYDFKLRTNATFQDGSPITADDVAFSLSRAVNPDTVEGDTSLLAGPAFLSDI